MAPPGALAYEVWADAGAGIHFGISLRLRCLQRCEEDTHLAGCVSVEMRLQPPCSAWIDTAVPCFRDPVAEPLGDDRTLSDLGPT